MSKRTDKEILFERYTDYIQNCILMTSKENIKNFSQKTNALSQDLSNSLINLKDAHSLPIIARNKRIMIAKSLILQYIYLKGRNKEWDSEFVDKKIKTLLDIISAEESDVIKSIRTQEAGGEKIDLYKILRTKKNSSRLLKTDIKDILLDSVREVKTFTGTPESKFYITSSGKKYHIKNCPYCKKENLQATNMQMIKLQNYIPCKCVAEEKEKKADYENYVTVFVDESIKTLDWGFKDIAVKNGMFSCIITKGSFESEKEIQNSDILFKKCLPASNAIHTEEVTKEAISYVLYFLKYSANFSGNVLIHSDNTEAVKSWSKIKKNLAVANDFKSVTVKYIPREENTLADALCRKQYGVTIPKDLYNRIINIQKENTRLIIKQKEYKDRIKELEEEKKNNRFSFFKHLFSKFTINLDEIENPVNISL